MEINYMQEAYITLPNRLLKYYHVIGLSENEILFIIQILASKQTNQTNLIDSLSKAMNITEKTAKERLKSLIIKGLLSVTEDKKIDFSPIWEALNRIDENHSPEITSNKLDSLVSIFEREFGRLLSPLELETISFWKDVEKFEDKFIIQALKEAVISKKLSLRYIDRILLNWKKEGLKTIDDVLEHATNFRRIEKTQPRKKEQGLFSYNWLDKNTE